jgi:hypothetical protein
LSPAVILYDPAGVAMAVANGVAVPVGTQGLILAGQDTGGTARFLRTHTDGTVKVDPTGTTTQPVSGPLTDAQLRATAVPVADGGGSLTVDGAVTANAGTGPWPVTDNGGSLTVDGTVGISGTVPVSGPLTDTQLRASAVPVTGPLTDAQLRATAVPVSAASLPLPTGAATEATLALVKAKTDNIDVALSTRAEKAQLPAALVGGRLDENVGAWLGSTAPTVGQKAMVNSVPVAVASDQAPIPVTFTQALGRTGISSGGVVLGGSTANTLQVMRATTYTEPTSAAQRSLASASANDAAAGTGGRTVKITYYDGAGAGPLTETVTLNGTSAVNTVATNIQFIEKMEVVTVGSLGANAAAITLYGSTGGGGGVVEAHARHHRSLSGLQHRHRSNQLLPRPSAPAAVVAPLPCRDVHQPRLLAAHGARQPLYPRLRRGALPRSQAVSVGHLEVVTSDGRQRVAQEKSDVAKKTVVSHDWTDPTTWAEASVRVVDEVASDDGAHTDYSLAHGNVIDTYHGKVSQEDFLLDAGGNSYRVTVKVNDVAKVEQDPHPASGGDFTVNYPTGKVGFLSALQPDDVVKVTYHYATTSVFTLKPDAGKALKIEFAECNFSDDVELLDSVVFQPYGFVDVFAPQLLQANGGPLPPGTKIPLGNPVVYKAMSDFQNDAVKSYPTYPALGGNGWRGSPRPIIVLDWDYVSSTLLRADYGMEIRLRLQHDVPFGGWYATATFYCLSEAP